MSHRWSMCWNWPFSLHSELFFVHPVGAEKPCRVHILGKPRPRSVFAGWGAVGATGLPSLVRTRRELSLLSRIIFSQVRSYDPVHQDYWAINLKCWLLAPSQLSRNRNLLIPGVCLGTLKSQDHCARRQCRHFRKDVARRSGNQTGHRMSGHFKAVPLSPPTSVENPGV